MDFVNLPNLLYSKVSPGSLAQKVSCIVLAAFWHTDTHRQPAFRHFIRTRATEFKEPRETRICVQLLHQCFVCLVYLCFSGKERYLIFYFS